MEPLSFKKLAANFSFLTGGEIFSKICTFAAFTYLARTLGPQQFGYLEFALAIMVFLSLFVDFGSSPYGAREIALNPESLPHHLTKVISLRILLALLAVLVVFCAVPFLPQQYSSISKLLTILSLSLLGIPFFLNWVFQGLDRMKWVAIGSIVRQLTFASLVFFYFRKTTPLWHIGLLELLAVSSVIIYYWGIYSRYVAPPKIKFQFFSVLTTIKHTAPIGLSEIGWASMWYSATIMLGLIVGGEEVGWFGVAHRTVMAIHAFVWLYFYNLLPSISRCKKHPEQTLQSLMANSFLITSWSSLFFAVLATVFAGQLMSLLYGVKFIPAAPIFLVLAWMIPISLLSGHYRYTLIAYKFQKYEFFSTLVAALLAIILGLLLIPNYGALGAALALILAKIVNFILAYIYVQRHIAAIPLLPYLYKPFVGLVVFFSIYLLLFNFNSILGITLASVSFLGSLIALEWRQIMKKTTF